MTPREIAHDAFASWYAQFPQLSSIGGGLVVLEQLQEEEYNLYIEAHLAPKGTQVRGVGYSAVKRILETFGETRPFLKEGGRTSRGLVEAMRNMLGALGKAQLDTLPRNERNEILRSLQEFLVEQAREFHNRKKIAFRFDLSKSGRQLVADLLDRARETGKDGPLAQHLVGAKLQLRYPNLIIRNESYSTADMQLNRQGDFDLGDTAFHVTVAPAPAVFDNCKRNIDQGYRAYLLVPDTRLAGARDNADLTMPGRIAVESIESFVSQNIEELSGFSRDRFARGFLRLIQTYNQRVDDAETDKAFMIEIPANLAYYDSEGEDI